MGACVVLADDDASLRYVLSQALSSEGYIIRATGSLPTLVKWLKAGEGDVVLSDVYMGEESLFSVLPALRAARPDLPFIVMSAQSTIATALSAGAAGVFDYAPKPFDLEALLATIRRALERSPPSRARAGAKQAREDEALPLVGRSPAMQKVYRAIARLAPTEVPVLIEGESGVGKECVARAIHASSSRAKHPFVAINLAAASASTIEEEFRAPTGAAARALGGVLMLKGVDELPFESQTRLVACLPNTQADEQPDWRLISSTCTDLIDACERAHFRLDLLHRLRVVVIRAPPLRERSEDIASLARLFLQRAQRQGLPEKVLDPKALAYLEAHRFPGNVRELQNILHAAAALGAGATIAEEDVAQIVQNGRKATSQTEPSTLQAYIDALFAAARPGLPEKGLHNRVTGELERPLIQGALAATHGNQIRAATLLGINRNTLRKKIQSLGIRTGQDD
ncbi:MAG: sigma-54 dependent transcriptional regulator [Terricaulis sp.]